MTTHPPEAWDLTIGGEVKNEELGIRNAAHPPGCRMQYANSGRRQRQSSATGNSGREQRQRQSSATVASGEPDMVTSGSFQDGNSEFRILTGWAGGNSKLKTEN